MKTKQQAVAPFEGAGLMTMETRETLAVMREASREMTGDSWREEMDQWLDDQEEQEEQEEREIPVTMQDARGYGWSITSELVDGFDD